MTRRRHEVTSSAAMLARPVDPSVFALASPTGRVHAVHDARPYAEGLYFGTADCGVGQLVGADLTRQLPQVLLCRRCWA